MVTGTQTFDEEFDGPTVDYSKWNIYAHNYWDKRTHFSKDNLILKDGKAILHYEKKTGFHNDDPNTKEVGPDRLRLRLPQYLWQMDATVRLFRGANEITQGPQPLARLLAHARPRPHHL